MTNKDIPRDYGRAIRLLLAAYKENNTQLAKRVGFTTQYVSAVCAGKKRPSLKAIERIADAYQVPVQIIMLLAARPEDSDIDELGKALLQLLAATTEEGAE